MVELNSAQKKLRSRILNPRKFRGFLLTSLPVGLFVGLRLRELDAHTCKTSVPFKWLTKNPFKSMYFAVQSMAAELSTASPCLLAVQGHKPSVAFIIVDMKATFLKKATGRVTFTCTEGIKAFEAVSQAISSGESKQITLHAIGTMSDGTVVSEFDFTWSFKQRSVR